MVKPSSKSTELLAAVQAQCILFRRYPEVLQPFKYAGYPLLLQAITLPANGEAEGAQQQAHFLSPEVAPRLQVSATRLGVRVYTYSLSRLPIKSVVEAD